VERDVEVAWGRADRRAVLLSRVERGRWDSVRAAFARAARIGLPCRAFKGTVTIRSLDSTRTGGFRGEIRRAATGERDTRPERGAGPPVRLARSPISLVSGRCVFITLV